MVFAGGSSPDGFAAAFPKLRTLNLARNETYGKATDFAAMNSLTSLNISGNLFLRPHFSGAIQVVSFGFSRLV
ncbi:hypothetical protein V6N13_066607 [Hibiscus sabdariffa]